MKRVLRFLIFAFFILSFFGCATVKGTFEGFAEDTQAAGKGVYNSWVALQKADKWFQENWW